VLQNNTIAAVIRVYGTVQGVGFRPAVWRLAHEQQLSGSVCNDGQGVLIQVQGQRGHIDTFIQRLQTQCPPLARIERIERECAVPLAERTDFIITDSQPATATQPVTTHIPADAATCTHCLADMHDPANRRYQYPFTNCTHCGPRLSIIRGIPYDRAQTSMAAFPLCEHCAAEYADPADRRFHAQPNACPACGPQVWFSEGAGLPDSAPLSRQRGQGRKSFTTATPAISAAAAALKAGKIVAIKGIGGVHLAVDAANESAINTLRQRKQRAHKPLALMARDLSQIETYCQLTASAAEQLSSAAAPIVLLTRNADCELSDQLAPGQHQLGFMLPYSPLHHLLMAQLDTPLVLTSGNLSSEPQCIENTDTQQRLAGIADAFLLHNRDIENRIDDSVSREMAGSQRLLRRARGYAPASFSAGVSFAGSPAILAMGSELKNTFCIGKGAEAVLSQHMGDLENFATYQDYQKNLHLYRTLYQHQPELIVVDKHPEYLSTKLGREWAAAQHLPVLEVAHHHAHIAACLIENRQPADTPQVLGIVLDGLGMGDDGTLWGGELLLADYRQATRLAHLSAVPLPGGAQAMREPWRNTYANLQHYGLWHELQQRYPELPIITDLQQKPLAVLDNMLDKSLQCPPASSCGRLFDAVAAATGICTEQISFEGQAAMNLEALVDARMMEPGRAKPYPLSWQDKQGVFCLDAGPMWRELFADLDAAKPPAVIAARFHLGLAETLLQQSRRIIRQYAIKQVVLSGGVFQNRVLFDYMCTALQPHAEVLTHRQVPANDGGLALGQWAVAAAISLSESSNRSKADVPWHSRTNYRNY
jgi:hydrogenase maturation protein HypF